MSSTRRLPSRFAELPAAATATMLLWISRTCSGLLVAYPLLVAIKASGLVSGPGADSVLFEPGSQLLLELLRVGLPLLSAGLHVTLLLWVLSGLLGLVPLAFAFDLLLAPGRSFGERLWKAVRLFPRLLGASTITLLAQLAVLLGCSLCAAILKSALQGRDPRWLDLSPLLMTGIGLLLCAWVGNLLDLARAALVERALDVRQALLVALTCLREQPWAVLLGSYPSVAGAALGYLSAAWLVSGLDLSGGSTRPIAIAFIAHQLAVLFAIAWRVRWLKTALELSGNTQVASSLR